MKTFSDEKLIEALKEVGLPQNKESLQRIVDRTRHTSTYLDDLKDLRSIVVVGHSLIQGLLIECVKHHLSSTNYYKKVRISFMSWVYLACSFGLPEVAIKWCKTLDNARNSYAHHLDSNIDLVDSFIARSKDAADSTDFGDVIQWGEDKESDMRTALSVLDGFVNSFVDRAKVSKNIIK